MPSTPIRGSSTKTLSLSPTFTTSDSGSIANANVVRVADAGDKMLRVMVRNISLGIDVQLSMEKTGLIALPDDSAAYVLPAGQADIFVLMPDQALFAATQGVGARISVAVSELFFDDLGMP